MKLIFSTEFICTKQPKKGWQKFAEIKLKVTIFMYINQKEEMKMSMIISFLPKEVKLNEFINLQPELKIRRNKVKIKEGNLMLNIKNIIIK